jgi:hypothetical protein
MFLVLELRLRQLLRLALANKLLLSCWGHERV